MFIFVGETAAKKTLVLVIIVRKEILSLTVREGVYVFFVGIVTPIKMRCIVNNFLFNCNKRGGKRDEVILSNVELLCLIFLT